MPFPTAQQVNLPACSLHCPINAERQAGKIVNSNFKVIGLIRLGIKPEFADPEVDAFTTRPSELLIEKAQAHLGFFRNVCYDATHNITLKIWLKHKGRLVKTTQSIATKLNATYSNRRIKFASSIFSIGSHVLCLLQANKLKTTFLHYNKFFQFYAVSVKIFLKYDVILRNKNVTKFIIQNN